MVEVFACCLCGDEFISDSFDFLPVFGEAGIEVQGTLVTKGQDHVDVGTLLQYLLNRRC